MILRSCETEETASSEAAPESESSRTSKLDTTPGGAMSFGIRLKAPPNIEKGKTMPARGENGDFTICGKLEPKAHWTVTSSQSLLFGCSHYSGDQILLLSRGISIY
ncbi:hypothetical protein K1719_017035 [Acacia pycnantha]|nr:hypothetical protein K1719_017035 [Acacia pycnantha]